MVKAGLYYAHIFHTHFKTGYEALGLNSHHTSRKLSQNCFLTNEVSSIIQEIAVILSHKVAATRSSLLIF